MKTSYQNRIPGHRGEVQKMVKEGPSIQRISEDLERELPRSIQEELSDQHRRRASSNIFKILTQGPLEKDFSRISTRFSHKSLYETMQKKIPSGSHQDLVTRKCKKKRTLTKIFMPGPQRESQKIVTKGPAAGEDLARSWYKSLTRASQKNLYTSTSNTWHLQNLHARTS